MEHLRERVLQERPSAAEARVEDEPAANSARAGVPDLYEGAIAPEVPQAEP